MIAVPRIFSWFSHLWLFQSGRGTYVVPYLPMDQLAYVFYQYRIVVLLRIPESIVWETSSNSVGRNASRSQSVIFFGGCFRVLVGRIRSGSRLELNSSITDICVHFFYGPDHLASMTYVYHGSQVNPTWWWRMNPGGFSTCLLRRISHRDILLTLGNVRRDIISRSIPGLLCILYPPEVGVILIVVLIIGFVRPPWGELPIHGFIQSKRWICCHSLHLRRHTLW